MFKFLFQFLNDYHSTNGSIASYIDTYDEKDLSVFLKGLEKFPFFEEVVHKIHEIIPDFNDLSKDERQVEFIKTMLDEDRLNYSYYPKGLFPFHKYKTHVSTAFEEHLFEGAWYASSKGIANLHFTISETHNHDFDEEFEHIVEDVEDKTKTKFNVSFSYQKKSTDTVALTKDNKVFRDDNGNLLFRASGHGALIENLNDLDYDIVFIKNIDNIAVYALNQKLVRYKKILAGVLIEAQDQAFQFLHRLDSTSVNEEDCLNIAAFLKDKMNHVIPDDFESDVLSSKIRYLKQQLNRPIRVCGMVKNEGEPGGGPFWIKDSDGNISLQIIEFAQIDIKNKAQADIVINATHFNPTDLVCGLRDYQGNAFDLTQYIDHDASFITDKTQAGKSIKALERPGLWNGSMAYWNSIFVEVPVTTFNPVKTVNDLLKAPHQVI